MSNQRSMTRVLKGKYQITRNMFVVCYLSIVEATDQEIRTLLKFKKNSSTQVPIGTKIFFDAAAMNKANAQQTGEFDIFSITVQRIEELNGEPVHICTPIQKETRPNLRSTERRPLNIPIQLHNSTSGFTAINGNIKGFTLLYTPNRAMVSLSLERVYNFSVHFKDEDYQLPAKIKHIQYDWKSHQHIIGISFMELSQDLEIILNLLIDPDFKIEISNNQTVDTVTGKISVDD